MNLGKIMTEEGKKWAQRVYYDKNYDAVKVLGTLPEHAGFWIRAFCQEVERRTSKAYGSTDVQLQGVVMDILKRELLRRE